MRVLLEQLSAAGFQVVETVYGNTWLKSKSYPIFKQSSWDDAELVVINGEGTMHDDARLAVYYLEEVIARAEGKRVVLVNSLWQRMSESYRRLLDSRVDLVTLREPGSWAELGIERAHVMPDLSFYEVPHYAKLGSQGLVKGTFYKGLFQTLELDNSIDVGREDWSVLVNKLRHADACITGKHHEVLACCVARCPFLTPKLDTHKVSALGAFVGAELPTIRNRATVWEVKRALRKAAVDQDNLYRDLFDAMESLREQTSLSQLITQSLPCIGSGSL